eukprot:CAMPEP_0176019662 /NCGR_PEP_ID=MMETSP0120_2-20121206/9505_1 /TAXON_ID=160619 /ORGANISM="Kryptoperidinium foliaceum, Strain CCMP 1326" /LENGTH=904 /DNA_ID=CAMNT_0017352743 /DNA_START=24 /DNA_END=2738 /DNA_ORIENTATION=+
MEPLLGGADGVRQKQKGPFGWWPLFSEVVPQSAESGGCDKALVVANIVAGIVIGVRQGLSAIMTASLIFNTAGDPALSDMFGFGTMMWYSSCVSALWYGLFGRLQYGLIGINDVVGILWGTLGAQVAHALRDDPERIPPTQLAVIMISTLLTGACSIGFGKLGLGKLMLLFPAPVTSGFLGSIGFFIVKSAMQMCSGVKFQYLWPVDFAEFLSAQSMGRIACMCGMLMFMWYMPPLLKKAFPQSDSVKKLGGLVCQLLPLLFFYLGTSSMGISMHTLTETGWTYPKQGSSGPLALWTSYDLREADWELVLSQVPSMGLIVLMSVLCTMTGVLGISAKFPVSPPGDPSPSDSIDYDRELMTAGWADLILGLTGGIITFHRLGSTVQLRMDGGTHRISVFACSVFCCGLFLSGVPIGHIIPRWFLGGLFLNSAISLLKDALLYFRHLPSSSMTFLGRHLPSSQYFVTLACIGVAIIASPFAGIATGLTLSVFIFLYKSSETEPVSGVTTGSITVGRTKRPAWELKCLRREGDRILLLFLQGQLFFGSAERVARMLDTATSGLHRGRVSYCILSFARVIFIDASAAKQVKASVEKAARGGCRVLFCRMNQQVFGELWVAGAIKSLDTSMRHVLNDWGVQVEVAEKPGAAFDCRHDPRTPHVPDHGHHHAERELAPPPLVKRMTCAFVPIGTDRHDAFDTETDALDSCDDRLVEQYCYQAGNLEPHMALYREACVHGARLSEAAFDAMHGLPSGTMERLREHCLVHERLPHYTVLGDGNEPQLYFIFRGALAQLHKLHATDVIMDDGGQLHAEIKGFAGRGGIGKRLRSRLPPGHVAGKVRFFLDASACVDEDIHPIIQVSSRVAGYAEVWVLTRPKWMAMPDDLRQLVLQLGAQCLADDQQHSYLLE